jgi:hypothetical protein
MKRNAHKVLVRKPKRNHLEDLGIDGRITLKWILHKKGCEGVDWINLAQDKEKW